MSPARIALSLSAEDLANALDAHPDFRVQRRLEQMDRRIPNGSPPANLVGVAVSVRTSGFDHRVNQVVELAMQRFRLDGDGRIVETGSPRSWLEEPATPIPSEVTRITGLTNADVVGRTIADGEATGLLLDADFVVAHGAGFDRPFVEQRLPMAAGRPWACSMRDVDWREEGFTGVGLAELLVGMGRFYDDGRADAAITALLHVLDHELSDGTTVAARMLDRAGRPCWVVDVEDAPLSAESVLRERGYVRDEARKVWSASIADDAIGGEIGWAKVMLYGGRREPAVRKVTWHEKYL